VQQRLQLEANFATAVGRCRQAGVRGPIDEKHAPSDGKMEDVAFVQCRAGTWAEAADGVIQRLEDKGVDRGQVLGIDAHTGNAEEEAIISAHYCTQIPSRGPLGLRFKRMEPETEEFKWAPLYERACAHMKGRFFISNTASCSCKGSGVVICFYYAEPTKLDQVEVVASRAYSWQSAGQGLAQELEKAGVQSGQLLWVDAHNHPKQSSTILLTAYYSPAIPGKGPLKLRHKSMRSSYSWKELYEWAAAEISQLEVVKEDVISVTFCGDGQHGYVGYVFHQDPGFVEPVRVRAPPAPQPKPKPRARASMWRWSWDADGRGPREPSAQPQAAEAPPEAEPAALQAKAQTDGEGFDVLKGHDTLPGKSAYQMPSWDLAACKRLCRQRGYGGFVVTKGKAHFRQATAEQCRAGLVRNPASTTYIAARPPPRPVRQRSRPAPGASMGVQGSAAPTTTESVPRIAQQPNRQGCQCPAQ